MTVTGPIGPADDHAVRGDVAYALADELVRLIREPRLPLLAVELGEAAATLGVSKHFFDEHVRHELRVVRRGRRVIVPLAELRRWLDENAARTLEARR